MTRSVTATSPRADTSFAPLPLNAGIKPRAARIAEGASPRAPSAPLTVASRIARAFVEAAVLAMLVLNIWIWAGALGGRV